MPVLTQRGAIEVMRGCTHRRLVSETQFDASGRSQRGPLGSRPGARGPVHGPGAFHQPPKPTSIRMVTRAVPRFARNLTRTPPYSASSAMRSPLALAASKANRPARPPAGKRPSPRRRSPRCRSPRTPEDRCPWWGAPVEEALHGEVLEELVEGPIRGPRLVEKAPPDGGGDVPDLPGRHRRASM